MNRISGKSRLVKYYHLAGYIHIYLIRLYILTEAMAETHRSVRTVLGIGNLVAEKSAQENRYKMPEIYCGDKISCSMIPSEPNATKIQQV